MNSHPLHPLQQDIFLDQLINYGNPLYNIGGCHIINGNLDVQIFKQVVNSLPLAFDVYKLRFDANEDLQCFFDDSYTCFDIIEIDFSKEINPVDAAHKWVTKRSNIAFELKKGNLLFEQFLLKISESQYWRFFKYHHLISDGRSVSIEGKYISDYYKSLVAGQPYHHRNYASYKDEIRNAIEYHKSEAYKEAANYWENKLTNNPCPPLIPVKNNAAGLQDSKKHTVEVNGPLLNSLKQLENIAKVSIQQISIAALIIYFHEVSGEDYFLFGMPIRKGEGSLKNIVGLLSGDIAFKGKYVPDVTVLDFIKGIAASQKHDYRYKNYLLADLKRSAKNIAYTNERIFDVMINFVNLDFNLDLGEGLTAVFDNLFTDYERFPLQIWWKDYGSQQPLELQLSYQSDLFDETTISLFTERLIFICCELFHKVNNLVSDIKVVPAKELSILSTFNSKAKSDHRGDALMPINKLLSHHLKLKKDVIALSYADVSVNYDWLSGHINKLANILSKGGFILTQGSHVVVLIDRSEWTVVLFLTMITAGYVYVPIDVTYPASRVRFILEDVDASLVIVQEACLHHIQDWTGPYVLLESLITRIKLSVNNNDDDVLTINPASPAYIIYTSGSTGHPKGVVVTHGNLSHFAAYLLSLEIDFGVRMAFLASSSFDISIFQMLLPLLHAGECIVVNQSDVQDISQLASILQRVTILDTVPGVYSQLTQYIADNKLEKKYVNVRQIFIGGDKIESNQLNEIGHTFTSAKVTVTYGPTEGTIFCTSIDYLQNQLQNAKGSILGYPIAGTEIFVLNANMDILPIGVDGEICIGGLGVSSGYRNLSDVTSCRFVRNKYGEGSLYLSGDRGRWTSSGELEFRGRLDEQVKIRGYRIEPGEVERSILSHPDISSAIVQAEPGPDGLSILRGYYTERQDIQLWPSISEYLGYNEIAYYAMNNDFQRADSYRRAIASKVKGLVVVDVGTGPEAILARHCLDSGALRVYAIEILEDVYERARDKVLSLGLSDRIIVLHGDVHDIELPEAVDYCVCALVGNLGSSDGCIPIMNSARRLLKDSSKMIPERSVTYMAAVDFLTKPLRYELTETGVYYMNNIFEGQGSRFDMRMCVQGIKESDLMSAKAIFEDLDLCSYQPLETETGLHLAITRPGLMSGFVLWLHLQASAGIENDILQSQQSFMPVYFPVFSQGLLLETGDIISGNIRRLSVPGTVYPDYEITGSIFRGTGLINEFSYQSLRLPGTYKSNAFYESLFGKTLNLPLKQPLTSGVLRSYLEDRLPGYMVPGSLIKLEKIPLTSNGKVDRKQLREGTAKADSEKVYIAPSGIIAIGLSRIWSELLGVSPIGMQSDFFELGGHSLLATRVVSAVRSVMGYELSIRDIFKYVTLETLSAYITTLPKVMGANTITIADRPAHIPLSFGQERLWFIDRLEGSTQYHIPEILKLQGQVDTVGLNYSFQQIITRHEVLRTIINEVDGQAYQEVISAEAWRLEVINEHELDDELEMYIGNFINKPFDLSSDYKLRASLINLTSGDHLLIIVLHHIAADGWSIPIVIKELKQYYQSYKYGSCPLPAVMSLQYIDYTLWQRSNQQKDQLQKGLLYWTQQLQGVQILNVPCDYVRPASQAAKGGVYRGVIPYDLQQKLSRLNQQEGVTMFMTLLTAFKVLLYRYSGQTDICVGSAIAGRQHLEMEDMVGFFVNTLALRSNLSDNPAFRTLLQRVRETTMAAYEHQDVPFEKVVETVVKERHISISPLFQVMFDYQNAVNKSFELSKLADVDILHVDVRQTLSKYDLTFTVKELDAEMGLSIEYNLELYKPTTIELLFNHYVELLNSIVNSPSTLISNQSILPDSELSLITSSFSGTFGLKEAGLTLTSLFYKVASDFEYSTALITSSGKRSYGSLNKETNQLGHYLQQEGVCSGSIVTLCLDKGEEQLMCMLGVLKAGGCYLPVEHSYPDERLSYIIKDSGSRILLTTSLHSSKFKGLDVKVLELDMLVEQLSSCSDLSVSSLIDESSLAYVLYTSGSTGYPRGVCVTHGNVVNYITNSETHYLEPGRSAGSGSYSHLSYTFDASVTALYMPLLHGRTLVMSSSKGYEAFTDPLFLTHGPYDFVKITPAHLPLFNSLLVSEGCPVTDRLVIGGEALYAQQIEPYLSSGIEIINEYGPTEATVGCSTYWIKPGDNYLTSKGQVSIGKPIGHVSFYILDEQGGICPVGVVGELCIGGDCVSAGYLNNAALTNDKYIKNPVKDGFGDLLYRTGDKCRWDISGLLLYEGREDNQIKLRGYRVSLDEIESQVLMQPNVSQCAVIYHKNDHEVGKLICYVVSANDLSLNDLENQLRLFLPEHMVPGQIIQLEQMYLTNNGKLDRKLLLEMSAADMPTGPKGFVAPQTTLEIQLAAIWQELLGVKEVGIYDNFFQLGGDSILIINLVSRLQKLINKEVQISDVYQAAHLHDLAQILSKSQEICSRTEKYEEVINNLNKVESGAFAMFSDTSNIEAIYPMTDIQLGMVYSSLKDPLLAVYHDQMVYRIIKNPDIPLLEKAITILVKKHEILRTAFDWDSINQGLQIVYYDVPVNIIVENQEHLSLDDGNKYVLNLLQNERLKPFNIKLAPLWRCSVIKLTNSTLLFFQCHHAILDGWSVASFNSELSELYIKLKNNASVIEADFSNPLKCNNRDFVIESLVEKQNLKNNQYWKDKLSDYKRLNIFTDKDVYRRIVKKYDADFLKKLREKAINDNLSLKGILFAAYIKTIGLLTENADLTVGLVTNVRPIKIHGEKVLGCFLNTIPFRYISKATLTWKLYFEKIEEELLEIKKYDRTSLLDIKKYVNLSYINDNPFFDTLFDFLNFHVYDDVENGLFEVKQLEIINGAIPINKLIDGDEFFTNDSTNTYLDVIPSITGNALLINFTLRKTLICGKELEELVAYFDIILDKYLNHDDTLISNQSILPDSELSLITSSFSGTFGLKEAGLTLTSLFYKVASDFEYSTALITSSGKRSYGSLNKETNQLGHYLQQEGVCSGSIVTLCLDKGEEQLMCMLGVLKAGGCYLPVEHSYPDERLSYIIKDSGSRILLTTSLHSSKFKGLDVKVLELDMLVEQLSSCSDLSVSSLIDESSLAYVLYTSGSTGYPRGVCVTHGNVVNYITNSETHYLEPGRSAGSGSYSHLSYTFDASVTALYMPLLHGRTLVMSSSKGYEAFTDPLFLTHGPYDFVKITPAHLPLFNSLLVSEGCPVTDRLVIGGEALYAQQIEPYLSSGIEIINEYGPTEATVGCSTYWIKPGDNYLTSKGQVSIGKPIGHVSFYILDEQGGICPVGVVGELCIGGDCVSAGYLNNAALTNDKYIKNPVKDGFGDLLYRTGDKCRWDISGLLLYEGREDNQIKLRGYRVSLDEIESQVLMQPNVSQCAVIYHKNDHEVGKLICYVVSANDLSLNDLENQLRLFLPEHMVPGQIIQLEQMYLTNNGKLDRKLLLEMSAADMPTGPKGFVAPQTTLEIQLAAIWQELLGVKEVGIYDNFFQLGGDSLLAIRLVSAIRNQIKKDITISQLFEFTSISAIAAYISPDKSNYTIESNEFTIIKL